jgi:hypothetical protein
MMNQEKILKLFKKFVGGVIDLHGLKCIPVSVGEFGTPHKSIIEFYPIQFKIKNSNDVPYYYSIVESELYDIVEEFSEYINLNLESEVLLYGTPKLYFNEEVKNKIQKVFDSVKEIKFTTGTPFIGYRRWVINIESVGFKTEYFDADSFYIKNNVVPISATKNGENVDVNEAINEYIDEFLPRAEIYHETERYYQDIDQVIVQYPLLSADYVATYYDTKFIR